MTEVRVERDGTVAVVTLDNPASANALTRAMIERLGQIWDELERDPGVRVVVVTAAGERHFCAGADLKALQAPGTVLKVDEQPRFTPGQSGLTKPLICAVNGVADGGGMGFVVDADIVVASENARFSDGHVSAGQVCGYAVLRLSRLISRSEASRLALAGRGAVIDAHRAHALGFVNELLPTPEAARRRARELAHLVGRNSPAAMRHTVRLLRQMAGGGDEREVLAEALDVVKQHFSTHPDAAEGPRALIEGREPAWTDPA